MVYRTLSWSLLLSLLLSGGAAPAAFAGESVIQAGIAVKKEGACSAALGFVVEVAPDKDKAKTAAEAALKARYPKANESTFKDNFKKDKFLGRHMVVLSAALKKTGCVGLAMGVGFGKDEKEAREGAEKNMGKHFTFTENSIKVEHSKRY